MGDIPMYISIAQKNLRAMLLKKILNYTTVSVTNRAMTEKNDIEKWYHPRPKNILYILFPAFLASLADFSKIIFPTLTQFFGNLIPIQKG